MLWTGSPWSWAGQGAWGEGGQSPQKPCTAWGAESWPPHARKGRLCEEGGEAGPTFPWGRWLSAPGDGGWVWVAS